MDQEQAKTLRGELAAIDDLLASLLPEDDLLTLVTDQRRRTAVATMVGTVTLARDLLRQARSRLREGELQIEPREFVKKPRKHAPVDVATDFDDAQQNGRVRGRIAEWVLEQLASGPKLRNELAIQAMTAGLCTASTTAYGTFKKLIQQGKITLNEQSNRVALA